jgi:hypothetical protein
MISSQAVHENPCTLPSATLQDHHNISVVFAGYHTPKPKNGLGDYRTIGRVSLQSSNRIRSGSNDPLTGSDQDDGR